MYKCEQGFSLQRLDRMMSAQNFNKLLSDEPANLKAKDFQYTQFFTEDIAIIEQKQQIESNILTIGK